jgi:hypothetical protein
MRGNAVARADFADASFIHLCLLCVAKLASASEIGRCQSVGRRCVKHVSRLCLICPQGAT